VKEDQFFAKKLAIYFLHLHIYTVKLGLRAVIAGFGVMAYNKALHL